jgi:hypothetical protein
MHLDDLIDDCSHRDDGESLQVLQAIHWPMT